MAGGRYVTGRRRAGGGASRVRGWAGRGPKAWFNQDRPCSGRVAARIGRSVERLVPFRRVHAARLRRPVLRRRRGEGVGRRLERYRRRGGPLQPGRRRGGGGVDAGGRSAARRRHRLLDGPPAARGRYAVLPGEGRRRRHGRRRNPRCLGGRAWTGSPFTGGRLRRSRRGRAGQPVRIPAGARPACVRPRSTACAPGSGRARLVLQFRHLVVRVHGHGAATRLLHLRHGHQLPRLP